MPRFDRRMLVPLLAALTLIAGFAVAQTTDSRPLGGAVLAAGVAGCVAAWWRWPGRWRASAAVAVFAVAFAVSHPLAGLIGAWPSLLLVSSTAAWVCWLLARSAPLPEPGRAGAGATVR